MTPMGPRRTGHKRCTKCDINLPSWLSDEFCEVHPDTKLIEYQWGEHDPKWELKLEAALEKSKVAQRAEHLKDLGEYAQIKGEVFWDHGLCWISSHDLSRSGLWSPTTFLIIQVGDKLYELQGKDDPRRRWWIEEVTYELDLPVSAEQVTQRKES